MTMGSPSAQSLFRSLAYTKTVEEIQAKVALKVVAVKAKILERESRIVDLRKAFDISDEDMIDLVSQHSNEMTSNMSRSTKMSYNLNSQGKNTDTPRTIGAGVVQNLLTERHLIQEEREAIVKLEFIQRNLREIPRRTSDGTPYTQNQFELPEADLEYLGF